MKIDEAMEIVEELTNDAWTCDLDSSQLCRICANPSDHLIPIFQGEGLEHDLQNKIKKHLPIKVLKNDRLPTVLCYPCASTLIAWSDLVSVCVAAKEKFNSFSMKGEHPINKPQPVIKKDTGNLQYKYSTATQPEEIEVTNLEDEIAAMNNEVVLNATDEDGNLTIEEVKAMSPQPVEISSDPNEAIYQIEVKNEDDTEMVSLHLQEGNNDMPVEFYEDVETSVVVQNFVETLESGEYIAYITDDCVESSVEVMGEELVEVTDIGKDAKPFICEVCNSIFTNINEFKIHLNTHKSKGHYCQYCNVYYKRLDHLDKHIEIMHPKYKLLVPREKKVNPYAKTFLCNTCGKILKSSLAYENHTLKHQSNCPFSCEVCLESFPNRGARRRHEVKEHNMFTKENGNPDGYHVCEICGLEMFSDGAYYHHKDKHGDPYPCGFCGKLYGSRSLMQVHARRHTNERPFACTLCNRNFKVKQELNAHMNIHKDVRPYQCPHCPKMCRKSSDLTHHIRTHTGEKPFICDKCGRGFAQAGDMRKHRLLHFRPSKINKCLVR